MVLSAIAVLLLALTATAHAGPATTSDSLDRLEELLQLRMEDGRLTREQVVPAILSPSHGMNMASREPANSAPKKTRAAARRSR